MHYTRGCLYLQMLFLSSAIGLYFPWDFCLFPSMTPLVSFAPKFIPAAIATLGSTIAIITIYVTRWATNHYLTRLVLTSSPQDPVMVVSMFGTECGVWCCYSTLLLSTPAWISSSVSTHQVQTEKRKLLWVHHMTFCVMSVRIFTPSSGTWTGRWNASKIPVILHWVW